MKLSEYEYEISKAERLEVEIDLDQYGDPMSRSKQEAAAEDLRELSVSIRRCCWNGPYKAAAMKLANRADASAARLEESEGVFRSRFPRWPASYQSCSGYAPAID